MCVNNELLSLCEELLSTISSTELKENRLLRGLIDDLIDSLSDEVTRSLGDDEELMLIRETQEQLQEILEEISRKEQRQNPQLSRQFDELSEYLDLLYSEKKEEQDELLWEHDDAKYGDEDRFEGRDE